MFASLHSCGRTPRCNDLLNSTHRDGAITGAVSLRRWAGILSGHVALLVSRSSSTIGTSLTVKVRLVITGSIGSQADSSGRLSMCFGQASIKKFNSVQIRSSRVLCSDKQTFCRSAKMPFCSHKLNFCMRWTFIK